MNTDIFKNFIELAKEYRELARCNGYAESFSLNDKHVRCYFADSGNHTSVAFGNHDNRIDIGFHSTVQFSDLTVNSISNLEHLYSEYVDYLSWLKSEFESRSEEETLSDKQRAINGLKDRLQEMEMGK